MKERPILFSGEMVRAILEGRKTQTRRVCKFRITGPNPPSGLFDMYDGEKWIGAFPNEGKHSSAAMNSPYGQPGDRLWVRETFLLRAQGKSPVFRAVVEGAHGAVEAAGYGAMYGGWKPSIFMPRWASRISLEIAKVRVERVQDISEADARAEGISQRVVNDKPAGWHWLPYGGFFGDWGYTSATFAYQALWDEINGNAKGGIYAWARNPWVWVVEGKRLP